MEGVRRVSATLASWRECRHCRCPPHHRWHFFSPRSFHCLRIACAAAYSGRTRQLQAALSNTSDSVVKNAVQHQLASHQAQTQQVGSYYALHFAPPPPSSLLRSHAFSTACASSFLQLLQSADRKQRVLHVMLRSMRQSLQSYSATHHVYAASMSVKDMPSEATTA